MKVEFPERFKVFELVPVHIVEDIGSNWAIIKTKLPVWMCKCIEQIFKAGSELFYSKPDLKTVFDTDKKPPVVSKDGKDGDSATPMKKIQQNRAKWRDSQKKNLEESWGSLNMFDRHQKGRISMDLDGTN